MASNIIFLVIAGLASSQYASSYAVPGNDNDTLSQKLLLPDKQPCPDTCALYKNTSACYKIGSKGPCGQLQLFYRLSKDSPYGDCACETNADGCDTAVKANRLLLKGPDNKQCYWAFSTGPCAPGEWYVLNKERQPECRPNPCLSPDKVVEGNVQVLGIGDGLEDDKFTFVYKSTCLRTYTQGNCKPGEYVQFLGTIDPTPTCFDVAKGPPSCGFKMFGFAPIVGMPCDAGYKPVGDSCIPADIDFE